MIRLLADENFPGLAVDGLIDAGFDVLTVARLAPGANDIEVLKLARDEERFLLTFDADFGDLIFLHGALAPPAILYFRIHPVVVADLLVATLRALGEVKPGHFAVVSLDATRLRPLGAKLLGGRGS